MPSRQAAAQFVQSLPSRPKGAAQPVTGSDYKQQKRAAGPIGDLFGTGPGIGSGQPPKLPASPAISGGGAEPPSLGGMGGSGGAKPPSMGALSPPPPSYATADLPKGNTDGGRGYWSADRPGEFPGGKPSLSGEGAPQGAIDRWRQMAQSRLGPGKAFEAHDPYHLGLQAGYSPEEMSRNFGQHPGPYIGGHDVHNINWERARMGFSPLGGSSPGSPASSGSSGDPAATNPFSGMRQRWSQGASEGSPDSPGNQQVIQRSQQQEALSQGQHATRMQSLGSPGSIGGGYNPFNGGPYGFNPSTMAGGIPQMSAWDLNGIVSRNQAQYKMPLTPGGMQRQLRAPINSQAPIDFSQPLPGFMGRGFGAPRRGAVPPPPEPMEPAASPPEPGKPAGLPVPPAPTTSGAAMNNLTNRSLQPAYGPQPNAVGAPQRTAYAPGQAAGRGDFPAVVKPTPGHAPGMFGHPVDRGDFPVRPKPAPPIRGHAPGMGHAFGQPFNYSTGGPQGPPTRQQQETGATAGPPEGTPSGYWGTMGRDISGMYHGMGRLFGGGQASPQAGPTQPAPRAPVMAQRPPGPAPRSAIMPQQGQPGGGTPGGGRGDLMSYLDTVLGR